VTLQSKNGILGDIAIFTKILLVGPKSGPTPSFIGELSHWLGGA